MCSENKKGVDNKRFFFFFLLVNKIPANLLLLVAKLYLTLCDPMDSSPPGSSVHGILQVRTLEWVAMPTSGGCCQPRDRTHVSCGSCIAGGFFTLSHWGSPIIGAHKPKQQQSNQITQNKISWRT